MGGWNLKGDLEVGQRFLLQVPRGVMMEQPMGLTGNWRNLCGGTAFIYSDAIFNTLAWKQVPWKSTGVSSKLAWLRCGDVRTLVKRLSTPPPTHTHINLFSWRQFIKSIVDFIVFQYVCFRIQRLWMDNIWKDKNIFVWPGNLFLLCSWNLCLTCNWSNNKQQIKAWGVLFLARETSHGIQIVWAKKEGGGIYWPTSTIALWVNAISHKTAMISKDTCNNLYSTVNTHESNRYHWSCKPRRWQTEVQSLAIKHVVLPPNNWFHVAWSMVWNMVWYGWKEDRNNHDTPPGTFYATNLYMSQSILVIMASPKETSVLGVLSGFF